MAQLIIIRGNSGSGKTTLAQRLQKTLGRNTLVISQDVVRREMLWVRDNDGNPSIELMSQLLRYGRANCRGYPQFPAVQALVSGGFGGIWGKYRRILLRYPL